MLERIFGKTKVQDPEPDVKPKYIVPKDYLDDIDRVVKLGAAHEVKQIITKFLKTLNRPDLLAFEDADQFKDAPENVNEWAWEAFTEEEWKRDWPLGKQCYENTIPDLIRSEMKGYDELKKTVDGLQKKLDRLAKIVENTEVTMSGKTAINL